jgi:hypothetical protein
MAAPEAYTYEAGEDSDDHGRLVLSVQALSDALSGYLLLISVQIGRADQHWAADPI